jgi:hypothetical protein
MDRQIRGPAGRSYLSIQHKTRCSVPTKYRASSPCSPRSPSASTPCGKPTGTYAADVVLRSPDPQDPRGIQRRLLERLAFTQAVLDNLPHVLGLLTEASSTDEALINIAALLNVEEAEVMVALARFDCLTLTRPATERRLAQLAAGED